MRLITRRGALAAAGSLIFSSRPSAQVRPSAIEGAALVVGVSQYDKLQSLPSAVMDASLIASSFRSLGLNVSLLIDSSQAEFLEGLARFQAAASSAPVTLIYVAAHGGISNGQSFVLFKDAIYLTDRVPETVLLQAMNKTARQKIAFLDCCRNVLPNTDTTPSSIQQYLAGIHVSYAAQPGAPAFDGGNSYSPFALALQEALEIPGLEIAEVARRVRLDVIKATDGQQIPWERSSLIAPVVLHQRL